MYIHIKKGVQSGDYFVTTDIITLVSATVGGGFFGGLLFGYAIKKVVKLIAVIAGLSIAGFSIFTTPVRKKPDLFGFSLLSFAILLVLTAVTVSQVQVATGSGTSPYQSGYNHGCSDARIQIHLIDT
jgi:hypothetical protein